jgi:hypothetical protein
MTMLSTTYKGSRRTHTAVGAQDTRKHARTRLAWAGKPGNNTCTEKKIPQTVCYMGPAGVMQRRTLHQPTCQ